MSLCEFAYSDLEVMPPEGVQGTLVVTAVCPVTDQRGVARDAVCDVGAFEYVP